MHLLSSRGRKFGGQQRLFLFITIRRLYEHWPLFVFIPFPPLLPHSV